MFKQKLVSISQCATKWTWGNRRTMQGTKDQKRTNYSLLQPGQNVSGPDVKKKNLENLDCSTCSGLANLRKAINWV